jgi:hypothetical protein
MRFFAHVEDLRWTPIKRALVFGTFGTLIDIVMDDFAKVPSLPLKRVRLDYLSIRTDLVTVSPIGVFRATIDPCLIGGLLPSLPFVSFSSGDSWLRL